MNKLVAGDYVPDGFGGFVRLEQDQALLGQALFRLQARRGGFPLLPQLGSRLHTLSGEKPSTRQMTARQYCVEALQDLAVTVTDVQLRTTEDGVQQLSVSLQAGADTAQIEVRV